MRNGSYCGSSSFLSYSLFVFYKQSPGPSFCACLLAYPVAPTRARIDRAERLCPSLAQCIVGVIKEVKWRTWPTKVGGQDRVGIAVVNSNGKEAAKLSERKHDAFGQVHPISSVAVW